MPGAWNISRIWIRAVVTFRPRSLSSFESVTTYSLLNGRLRDFQKTQRPALRLPFQDFITNNTMAAHNGVNRPAHNWHAVVGRPAADAGNPVIADAAACLQIHNTEICIKTQGYAPLAFQSKNPGRSGTGQIHQSLQTQAACVYMVQHHGQQGLHASHATG